MITIANLEKGSSIRPRSDIFNDPNFYNLGPVKTIVGRYYLVALALHVKGKMLPAVYSTASGDGTSLSQIITETLHSSVILTTYPPALGLAPITADNTLGFFLFGGYCTSSNPSWSFTITFGANTFSSFAYSIDEVQCSTSSPILQPIAVPTNTATLSAPPAAGNAVYMTGASMVSKGAYPIVLSQAWDLLSTGYAENVVPNLITGYTLDGTAPIGWADVTGTGQQGPYLDRALIACELQSA